MATWQEEQQKLRSTIAQFPEQFGLFKFPGKVFRISPGASFVTEGQVMLYTEIQTESGWESFCKGTPEELQQSLVRIAAKDFNLTATLNKIPRPAQHQGSLNEQMLELRQLAVHFGLYDADDWLLQNYFKKS